MPANVLEENSRQMEKARHPYVDIGNSEVCAEVHACRAEVTAPLNVEDGPAQLDPPCRYLGAILCKDLYTITQILNNTRRGRSNQWTVK